MTWLLEKTFRFEASHQLPDHDGKCARLHGHSWRATVGIVGVRLNSEGPKVGMVVDFAELKEVMQPILDHSLDHWHLNDTVAPNPTSEVVARWIAEELEHRGVVNVAYVRVEETCTCSCTYYPTESPLVFDGFRGSRATAGLSPDLAGLVAGDEVER